MRLIMIRHGQSVINVTPDWSQLVNLDTELTEIGHQQAVALRDWLNSHALPADAFYVSTMRRTQETAEYVADALGIEAVQDERIREIGSNYADGRGIAAEELPRDFDPRPGHQVPFSPRASGVARVESWMHFRTRIGNFLDDMIERHLDETIYVVAHGGVMTALFEHIFNSGPRRFVMVETNNTGWSQIEYRKTHVGDRLWVLVHHNRIDHLVNR